METLKRKHTAGPHGQAKKLRMEIRDDGFHVLTEGCSSVEAAEETAVPTPEIEMIDNASPACSMEERAIVPYKPTIPELLMSQPISRAPTLPLDVRFLHAGIGGHESHLASDMFHQLVLRKGILPRDTPDEKGRAMLEVAAEGSLDNRLAVIPWVPYLTCTSKASSTPSQKITSKAIQGDEMGEHILESEAMDEDDVDAAFQSLGAVNVNGKYGPEPCQHYGVPQPQLGSVTWSH